MHFTAPTLHPKSKKNKSQTKRHKLITNCFWKIKNRRWPPKSTLKQLNNSSQSTRFQILKKLNHLGSQSQGTVEWIEEFRLIMYLEWHMRKQEEWQVKVFKKFNKKKVKLWKRQANGKSECSMTKYTFIICYGYLVPTYISITVQEF